MRYHGGHRFELLETATDGRSVMVLLDGQPLKAVVAARYESRGSLGIDTLELTFHVAEFVTTKHDTRPAYARFVDAFADAASQDIADKFNEARDAIDKRAIDALTAHKNRRDDGTLYVATYRPPQPGKRPNLIP